MVTRFPSLPPIRVDGPRPDSEASAFIVAARIVFVAGQNNVGLISKKVIRFVVIDQPILRMMTKYHVDVAWVVIEVFKLQFTEQ